MAELAIKGHPTRGKEVIEILEMLGGKNLNNLNGASNMYYLIGLIVPKILATGNLELDKSHEQFTYFTLEEFLEKYPYKVGDKVELNRIGVEITGMYWLDNTISYEGKSIKLGSEYDCLSVQDLKPYKEETIEEGTNKAVFEGNYQSCDIMNDIIKEEAMEEKGTLVQIDLTRELRIADKVEVILGDYEFVLKDGKTYFVKKNKYPKTYEECCKILGIEDRENGYCGYEYELLGEFQQLLICRDAWWKMADDWKPNWTNFQVNKFCIGVDRNITSSCNKVTGNKILAFPTAEMRDAFYDNFKDLIDKCKELL